MKFMRYLVAIGVGSIAYSLSASVYTPIGLVFDVTKSNSAFMALVALFFIETFWLRIIANSHIIKVLVVVPITNLASIAITVWGPYFLFERIITGKFTRYMVYINFKDFMASGSAFLNWLLILSMWLTITVAVEAMVVGIFYHTINKRSLITMLVTVHLMSVGVAIAPEVMKYIEVEQAVRKRAKPKDTTEKTITPKLDEDSAKKVNIGK
jgi:hypothetical protein